MTMWTFQLLQNAPVMTTDQPLSIFAVFIAGILSFFSPCILPVVPLYMAYLSGDKGELDPQSPLYQAERRKVRRRTLLNTLFFVLGISFVYLTLGYAANSLGAWLATHGELIQKIGAVLIIVLGLLQLINQIRGTSLSGEHRLAFDITKHRMNPLIAFVLGFTFSFAWTPCIGPILVSVIALVASSETQTHGLGLMLIYTLGFTIPFMFLGVFTDVILAFLKRHARVMKYTTILGAILMIVIGVLLFFGKI